MVHREVIGLALKSLGYSANSEDPAELEAALERLLALEKSVVFIDPEAADSSELMAEGRVAFAMSYALDYFASLDLGLSVEYVLPEDGALLWGDTFVIPASSPNKKAAEMLLNFLLRPENAAQIVEYTYYATANEMALPLISPEVRNEAVIFPDNGSLRNAEIIFPLSPQGQELYDRIWERFTSAGR
jgi:spermidine/putrescine transport system substrate-binding protein